MSAHKKHLWMMLACCLIPLAGLAAVWVFRIPATSVLYFGLILLCPLLHLIMMRGMMHNDGPTIPGASAHAHIHEGHPVSAADKAPKP
jgi:hypothetical protein